MSRAGLVLIAAGIVFMSGVGQAQDALVQKGQEAYVAQKCAMCHAVAGKGNVKGPLDKIGTKLKPEEMRLWITDAKTMAAKANAIRKPPMKDYSALPKADVDALVAYLQTLK
jgi:mono/diheme cytochrome c family protein